jgi:hypothetical protein
MPQVRIAGIADEIRNLEPPLLKYSVLTLCQPARSLNRQCSLITKILPLWSSFSP